MPTNNYILFYCPGLYPCKTGGMEIYNYFLVKSLLNDVGIKDKIIIITGCKKLINNETIFPLNNRLFLKRQFGLGALSTIVYYIFSRKIRWKKIKTIFIPYTSNFEHSAFSFLLLKKLFNVDYVLHIHGGGLKTWQTAKLQNKFFKNAKKIAGVSIPVVKEYEKRTNRNVEYLPPLISFKKNEKTKIFLKKEKALEQFNKIILFVGSLKPIKAPEVLIKAFLLLGEEFIKNNKLGLLIVGDGILRNDLQRAYSKHTNIIFTGKIPNEKVNEYYALADIYVIPSFFEGTPVALIEAMFNALVCIGSNVSGISEIIQNKKNGFLFKVKDYNELSIILKEVILNASSSIKKGINAYKSYNSNFSYGIHLENFKKFID